MADLVAEFEDENETTRWTVRSRLNELADDNEIERQEHANGNVTYRRPDSPGTESQ